MNNKNYPHTTKDSKGNIIHYKDSNGFEFWQEYDERGNEIYYKTIPNPNNITELTLEQIAEKFNVKVENIKIKK